MEREDGDVSSERASMQPQDGVVFAEVNQAIGEVEAWYEAMKAAKQQKTAQLEQNRLRLTAQKDQLQVVEAAKLALESTLHDEVQNRELCLAKIEKAELYVDTILEDEEFLAEVCQQGEIGRELAHKQDKAREDKVQSIILQLDAAKMEFTAMHQDLKIQVTTKEETVARMETALYELQVEIDSQRSDAINSKENMEDLTAKRITAEMQLSVLQKENENQSLMVKNLESLEETLQGQLDAFCFEHAALKDEKSKADEVLRTLRDTIILKEKRIQAAEDERKSTAEVYALELSALWSGIEDIENSLKKETIRENEQKEAEAALQLILQTVEADYDKIRERTQGLQEVKEKLASKLSEANTQAERAELDLAEFKANTAQAADLHARRIAVMEAEVELTEKAAQREQEELKAKAEEEHAARREKARRAEADLREKTARQEQLARASAKETEVQRASKSGQVAPPAVFLTPKPVKQVERPPMKRPLSPVKTAVKRAVSVSSTESDYVFFQASLDSVPGDEPTSRNNPTAKELMPDGARQATGRVQATEGRSQLRGREAHRGRQNRLDAL